MSYIERGLAWFLKERIFGGLKKLKERHYLPFAVLIVILGGINTILAALYHAKILIDLHFIQEALILQMYISLGLIVSGFVAGRVKNIYTYYFIVFALIFGSILSYIYFKLSYSDPIVIGIKLGFFFTWVLISSISMFFLLIYFFTSFPRKILMLGAPKGHVFFGFVVKIIIIISIPLYLLMIYQFSIGSIFIGVFGIFIGIFIYLLIKLAPKKVELVKSLPNFVGALGFFYIFLFYHLAVSFSYTSNNVSSLIADIIILFVLILYIVQSLTRKIAATPERAKSYEVPVRFQSRLYITDRLKKAFGEAGLILIVMGIALGYHMVYVDSFFITEYPLLSEFFTPGLKLSALYHRVYLIVSFIIIIIALVTFNNSRKFRDFVSDKYTFSQVLKYIGFYFKKTEDNISPFEYGLQKLGEKIEEGVKNIGKKWKDAFKLKENRNNDDNNT
ncbi:MAG: hypothetical protein ACP6IY_18355 [Promethearchaeia archaeon]